MSEKQEIDEKQLAALEQKLRALVTELRILEGSAGEVQGRINIVDAGLRDLGLAGATIRGLEEMKVGTDVILPIGGGSYLKAKIADSQTIILGIGAGVAIEKPSKDAVALLDERASRLQQARSSLEQQLVQILQRIEVLRKEIQKYTNVMTV